MLNDNAKAWIAALRSGDYSQTKGKLSAGGSYCCLGVACDLAVKAEVIPKPVAEYDPLHKDVVDHYWQNADVLPGPVMDWLGLNSNNGSYTLPDHRLSEGEYAHTSLADVNDAGATFEEIADIIEANQKELFDER